MEVYLKDIAHGRSGDKGDTSNVCVFARDPAYYAIIRREVTVEKVKQHFGDMVRGEIKRYEVPSLGGFNFVMKHALGGGATHSLRLDSLGKSMCSAFMRMKVRLDDPDVKKPAGALDNLVILDLTRVVAGPYCGSILADMGATVIKVEIPVHGDDARGYGPYINGESAYYANLNRNKLGITLNLKHPQGKALLLALVKKADILIENFRPDVMDRLGLGYEALKKVNNRLIYAAISGFGSYGAYANRPGYDIISQAMGGLMSITGEKGSAPTRSGNAMGDMLGGMNLAIGILAAIHAREKLGHGQRVDVSLVDSVVASLENASTRYFVSGKTPERNGNAYASIAPYDSFLAKDGYVIIACGNQKLYEILCTEILGKPELITDERFITVPLRVQNNVQLKSYIEAWTLEHTVNETVEAALAKGIPAGPIYDIAQIVADQHIAIDREMFIEIDHPIIGKLKVNGNPIKMMETMPRIEKPAPTLGEHNQKIYGEWLGISSALLEEYIGQGVI